MSPNVLGSWRFGGTLKQTDRFACRQNVVEWGVGGEADLAERNPSRRTGGGAATDC